MIKKCLGILALLLLLLPLALAEEAQDITAECTLKRSAGKYKPERMIDRDYATFWQSDAARNQYVELTAPKDKKIYGVYITFWDTLRPWRLQVLVNGNWQEWGEYDARYAHEFVALDGVEGVRIMNAKGKKNALQISEIYVFSQGEIPAFVQQWQPAPDKVDILFIAAHPDDELLFFGGAIPYYAGEMNKRIQVAYMTCGTSQRRSELLNGLWMCGVRTYPDIGNFWDKYAKTIDKEYAAWGKAETYQRICQLYRQYRPDVVVTHDVNGEYGHAGHLVCADAALKCADWAADETRYTASVNTYGTWQIKKLYRHLGKDNVIEMDWDQPLDAFEGKTGYEVAAQAYTHHVSQQKAGQKNLQTGKWEYFVVEPKDSKYSSYRFSLVYTKVGDDTEGKDFLENIPVQ